jgi:predicted alpha/beta hydrolase family esterase
MKTLILPGFSIKNKDWAESIQKELSGDFDCEVVYWPHWETEVKEEDWIEKEAQKIIQNNSEPINIIAKSIGTTVAAIVIDKNPEIIHKLILCGIPLNDLDPGEGSIYDSLNKLDPKVVLSIQNNEDPHGSFTEVEKLIHDIQPNIEILSQKRDDHEYPDANIFIKFLNN